MLSYCHFTSAEERLPLQNEESVLYPLSLQCFHTEFFQEIDLHIGRSYTLSCAAWGLGCAAELVYMRHVVQSKVGYELYSWFLMCTQRRLSWGVTFSPSKKEMIALQKAAHRHTISELGYHKLRSNPTVPCAQCTEPQGGVKILFCHYSKDPIPQKRKKLFLQLLPRTKWIVGSAQDKSHCADYTNLSPAEASSSKLLSYTRARDEQEKNCGSCRYPLEEVITKKNCRAVR